MCTDVRVIPCLTGSRMLTGKGLSSRGYYFLGKAWEAGVAGRGSVALCSLEPRFFSGWTTALSLFSFALMWGAPGSRWLAAELAVLCA